MPSEAVAASRGAASPRSLRASNLPCASMGSLLPEEKPIQKSGAPGSISSKIVAETPRKRPNHGLQTPQRRALKGLQRLDVPFFKALSAPAAGGSPARYPPRPRRGSSARCAAAAHAPGAPRRPPGSLWPPRGARRSCPARLGRCRSWCRSGSLLIEVSIYDMMRTCT